MDRSWFFYTVRGTSFLSWSVSRESPELQSEDYFMIFWKKKQLFLLDYINKKNFKKNILLDHS